MAKLTFIFTFFLISLFYVVLAVPGHDFHGLDRDLRTKPFIVLPSQKNQEPDKTTETIRFEDIIPDKTDVDLTEIHDDEKSLGEMIENFDKTEVGVTRNQDDEIFLGEMITKIDNTPVVVTGNQDHEKSQGEMIEIQDKPDVKVTENQGHEDSPMKIVRFHPINRHFPASQLGSLRLPLHRCRHGKDLKRMNRFGPFGERNIHLKRPRELSSWDDMIVREFKEDDLNVNRMNRNVERNFHLKRPREFSFGDDMMVRTGENGDFNPMVHVEIRQVPEQWIIHRHHRHHHQHHDGMPRFPMGKHHDFFANHRFGEERDVEREDAHEKKDRPSFMRSIRKFLNGQF